jgi:hypothetical protein
LRLDIRHGGRMCDRRLEVLLPADLTNHEYVAIAAAFWGVLNATGIAEDSSMRADERISVAELNAASAPTWSPTPERAVIFARPESRGDLASRA